MGITLPVIIDAEAVALQACVRDSDQLLGVMAALGCRASRAGEFRVCISVARLGLEGPKPARCA